MRLWTTDRLIGMPCLGMRCLGMPCLGMLCLALLLAAAPLAHALTLEEAQQLHDKVRALILRQQFIREDYAAAVELELQVLATREEQLGAEHPDTASAVEGLANLHARLGNFTLSEQLYLRVLATREKVLGADHEFVARTLCNLGLLYVSTGEYPKAESLLQRALSIAEARIAPEHPSMIGYLTNLSLVYLDTGQLQRAEPLALRALATARGAFGPEHPAVGDMSDTLGLVYLRQGEYAKAEPLYSAALRLSEQNFGIGHPATALALDHLGVLFDNTGQYRKAEPLLQRALAIREKALGAQDPLTALSIEHLGVLSLHAGDYVRAEALLQRAIRVIEQRLGPEHPDTARALSNLGAVYSQQGAYPKAEELHQRALRIRRQKFAAEHSEIALSLHNLAEVYAATGAYAQAEDFYQQALAMREKLLGPTHPYTATTVSALAKVYSSSGSYTKAEALLERALRIREAALGPEHPFTAAAAADLGTLYRVIGAHEKSEPLLQRALQTRQRVLAAEHTDIAASSSSLAALYFATGRELPAVQLQERACTQLRRVLGIDHPDTAACLNDFALMQWSLGGAARALPLLAEAQAAQARYSLRLLRTGSEARKRAFLLSLGPDLANQVSFSVAFGSMHRRASDPRSGDGISQRAIELGLLGVLQYKGLLQDAMSNGVVRLRENATPQDRKLLTELARVAGQFSNLVYQTGRSPAGEPASAEVYGQRIAELDREQQRLETELAKRSSELRRQLVPVNLAQVRAKIPPDAVLIEWLRYRPHDPEARDLRSAGTQRYVAYVVSRKRAAAVIDVGAAPAIEASIAALRGALSDPERGDVKAKAAALAQLLYQPLRPHLQGARHLLISADGALNLVPVAALVDAQGRFLLERFEITYLTSGRDLLRIGPDQLNSGQLDSGQLDSRRGRSGAPVIVAAPAYGEPAGAPGVPLAMSAAPLRSAELDRSGLLFRPLPGALREGEKVARLLSVPRTDMLVAAAATEAALKGLRSPRLLHIATHGFFLHDQEPGMALAGPLPENPLLRSGLALAGANLRRSGAHEDGILTAFELAQLDLRRTELVVLSACESGVGEVQIGEGIGGLRRALVLAGAHAQLASLWQIADRPTQDLMVNYYQRLLRGSGRSAALREAQLKSLASPARSHPYYWAAFMPIGDWRALSALEGGEAQPAGAVRPWSKSAIR